MPEEILDGIYDITVREDESTGKRNRVFLFEGEPAVLVDTGFSETADRVLEGIDATGLEPEALVITHGDVDHIGAFDAIVEALDVETWVPAETPVETAHPIDNRFEDGDRIYAFTAVHVPGHTADNYVLVDEDRSVAVMGDALSGADQRGLEPGGFHLPPGIYSDDLVEADRSLERLLDFDFEAGLVFHGTSVLEAASVKIERYVEFPGKPDHWD